MQPAAGTAIPLKLREVWPALKFMALVLRQLPLTAPPTALNPLLSVSVKEALVRAMPLLLPSASWTRTDCPANIELCAKDLLMVMGTVTVIVAVVPVPVRFCAVETPEMVAVLEPELLVETEKDTVQ